MPDSLPRWLLMFLLALPLSATAQRSYNNWVNPGSGLPAPAAPKPMSAPSKPARLTTRAAGDSAAPSGSTLRVERMPQYPGGNEAMMRYIRQHLRRPTGAPRLSGPVRVTFTVLQNGAVTEAHVKPGNGLDARYDAAAVQVISALKGFRGGERDGQPADLEVTLPVEFR